MNQQKQLAVIRIGVSCGVVASILAFTCILVAIASYPKFSWTNNALSDLGVISGITGPLFNFGLFATGVLGLIFGVLGLYNYLKERWIGKISSLTFAAATIALMAIGVFNENARPTHYLASFAFFTLIPIALLAFTVSFYLIHEHKLMLFTLLISFAAGTPWILYFLFHYFPGVAIPEFISALAAAVWAITVSYRMTKQT
jgi:hypothetical membrane protein